MWIDDHVLEKHTQDLFISVYTIDSPKVVLGSGNRFEVECKVDNCLADQIPVLKRHGGGGTVVLHDGCIIISIGCWLRKAFQNDFYFRLVNGSIGTILNSLSELLPKVEQKGISDLVAGNKKIGGTSMFRSKNYMLYQLSLLVDPKVDLIERYLDHPSKEPDYRKGKSHRDFIAGIQTWDNHLSVDRVRKALKDDLEKQMRVDLGDELSTPRSEQYKNITNRISRNAGNDVIEKYLDKQT